MSHKIELNNGRIAYCETINPKKLNEIEARFGSKIKSVAGYDTTTKAENGTKAGGYVRDMSNLDIPMYIFNVFIRWDGMVKTSLPGYPSGKKYKNLRKKIELLEYTKPNEYTANFAPLNWVDNKGRRYFETYADGSNDDYFDDMTKSGYAAYYYFFPKDKFSVTEAQKLINAEHPRNFGFTLDKHPDLYAYGNKIPNHYNGMEGEEVWNNWNKTQRTHFLHDHFSGWTEHYEYIPFEYNKLPKKIQEEVDYHVSMGQYKKGGRMFKKGGSTEKPNFKKLAKTNHYGLDEKDLETLWDEGNVEMNHWTFFHVGNDWETIYDGLYMEVFSSFEDMLNRENQKAYYEYSEELSDKLGEETFADENGNIREYGDGGSIGNFFAQELGAIGTTIDKAEKGKKLGFAFQVGDKVMVNDRGYIRYFSEFDTSKPATILDRHKTKAGGKTYYSYEIQFADGRKPFNNAPQGLLEPYTEKMAKGGGVRDNRMNERTRAVILKIQKTGIHPNDVSPNLVNEIANEYNIKLTSEEVVFISDNYGNKMAKGGRVYSNLRKRFEGYTDEELQIFNGDNEETLKNWNREDAIEDAIHSVIEESDEFAKGGQTDLFDEEISEMVDETPDMTETKTKYRAEIGAVGDSTWSTNSMEYDTEDEAKNWLKGLASRWFGYNISRVVPVSTPRGETIDVSTQNIFQNYRKSGGTTFPIWRKQKYEGGGSTEQAKKGKKIDDARYPRRADDTGKGIMQGWVVGDAYYETEQGALQSVKDLGYDTIEDAYENDEIYFTDWHDENLEEQGYYYTADGKEIELSAKGSVVKISKSEMDEMANRGMNKLTKKNWKVIYITMQGKEGSKIIELGRLSDREDVKNALKRMPDLNIREIVKIQEIAEKGTKINISKSDADERQIKTLEQYGGDIFMLKTPKGVYYDIVSRGQDMNGAFRQLKTDANGRKFRPHERLKDKETYKNLYVSWNKITFSNLPVLLQKDYLENWNHFIYKNGGNVKAEKGTKTGKGFMVFNYTDNIYASPDIFKTRKEANEFIAKFRARFEKQGYYRDNRMRQIAIKDIDLLAIPEDFNPFRKN